MLHEKLPGWKVGVDLESEDVALIGWSIGSLDPYPEELAEWIGKLVGDELQRLRKLREAILLNIYIPPSRAGEANEETA